MTRRGGQRAKQRRTTWRESLAETTTASHQVMDYTIKELVALHGNIDECRCDEHMEALIERFNQLRGVVNRDRAIRSSAPASLRRTYEATEKECNDALTSRVPTYAARYASRLTEKGRIIERMRRAKESRGIDREFAMVILLQARSDWKRISGLTCLDERILRSAFDRLRISITRRHGFTRSQMRVLARILRSDGPTFEDPRRSTHGGKKIDKG